MGKRKFTPVGFKVYQMLVDNVKFEPIDIICVTRRQQGSNTRIWHYRTQKFNFFLRGFKNLILVRKPEEKVEKPKSAKKVKWQKYK